MLAVLTQGSRKWLPSRHLPTTKPQRKWSIRSFPTLKRSMPSRAVSKSTDDLESRVLSFVASSTCPFHRPTHHQSMRIAPPPSRSPTPISFWQPPSERGPSQVSQLSACWLLFARPFFSIVTTTPPPPPTPPT